MRDEEQVVGADVPVSEQSPRDYDRMVNRMNELLGNYISDRQDLTPYVGQNQAAAR